MATIAVIAARTHLAKEGIREKVEKLAGKQAVQRLDEARAEAPRHPQYQDMRENEVLNEILGEMVAAPAATIDYPLSPLDQDVVEALVAAGYEKLDGVREASDEELLAVKGIGPKTLKDIRGAVG
jgi:DNA uptake protein ComE-like DNA-binding protein